MHTLLCTLLIGALGLQSALGCCCRLVFCAGARPVTCSSGCCHHQTKHSQKPAPTPCKCQLQCGGSYVSTPKTMLTKPHDLARYDMPTVVPVTIAGKSALQSDCDGTRARLGASLPLYLAHQILLL